MALQAIPYEVGGRSFTGFLADGSGGRPAPGVLVAHEGGGLTDHPKDRAQMLADEGYVAFVLDLFGEPVTSIEQAQAHVARFRDNARALRDHARAALDLLRGQANVDPARVAAIGFCFGGTTVLELARDGADVACVVGFHAGLATATPQDAKNIKGKVLVCQGTADPIIGADQRDAFAAEMSEAGVDWQMLLLGGVAHSFTNPLIDAWNLPGFAYDSVADRRAWAAMRELFDEVFGPSGR